MNALTSLETTPFYNWRDICVDDVWEALLKKRQQKNLTNTNTQIEKCDDTYELDNEPIFISLIHLFNDTQLIKYLDTKIIKITPSKGIKHLGIFQDVNSQEMSFPTLFYGYAHPIDITTKFSFQKIVKWELMHQNNDFKTHILDTFSKVIR